MKPIDPSYESYVPIFNIIWTIMDEEGSVGSKDDAEKVKVETESGEDAIKLGMAKASENTSMRSQEETASQFAPNDMMVFSDQWTQETSCEGASV